MNSESELVQKIIQGLMTPNNEERRKNEAQLMELMQKNKMGLVLCLTQILNTATDHSCLLYSAVIARKLIQVPESESYNQSWKSAPEDIKEQEIYMKVSHLIMKNGILYLNILLMDLNYH